MSVLGEGPMMCPDQPGRQSVQKHRLVFLVVEVLVEEEKLLLVSEFLVEKGMMLAGSGTLDKEERMVPSSGVLVGSWYFWDLFSWSELG